MPWRYCWGLETIQNKCHTAIHNALHEISNIIKENKVYRYNEQPRKECGGSNLVWWWRGVRWWWWWWQCHWWALLPLATLHTWPQTAGYHQCLWRGRDNCYHADSQLYSHDERKGQTNGAAIILNLSGSLLFLDWPGARLKGHQNNGMHLEEKITTKRESLHRLP